MKSGKFTDSLREIGVVHDEMLQIARHFTGVKGTADIYEPTSTFPSLDHFTLTPDDYRLDINSSHNYHKASAGEKFWFVVTLRTSMLSLLTYIVYEQSNAAEMFLNPKLAKAEFEFTRLTFFINDIPVHFSRKELALIDISKR